MMAVPSESFTKLNIEEKKVKKKLETIEDILEELTTGSWNLVIWAAVCLCYQIMPANTMWGAYVTPSVNFTCRAPEGGIPVDECYFRYETDNSTLVSCTEWNYDKSVFTNTITSQFDLVCENSYLRAFYSSIYWLGSLIGAPVGGYAVDSKGRKVSLFISVFVYTVCSVILNWMPWEMAILVIRFFMGMMHPIILSAMTPLKLEVCVSKHRAAVGVWATLPWSIGMIIYGVMAYLIRDWRWLQFAMSLQCVVLLPALWYMDESIRWLTVNGRKHEAFRIIKKAEKWNCATLPSDREIMQVLDATEQSAISKSGGGGGCSLKEVRALMNPLVRSRVIIMWFEFLVAVLVYYGLSMGADIFHVDPFLYMVLSGLMEVPSYILIHPLMQRFGRRITLAANIAVCGVSVLALTIIPADINWLIVSFAMIGKLCVTSALTIVVLYVTELLPTEIRSTGMGSCLFVSRLGAIVTPFATNTLSTLIPWGPSALFGITSLIAAVATLKLPETLNKPLLDTVAQMDQKTPKNKSKRIKDCEANSEDEAAVELKQDNNTTNLSHL